MAPREPRIRLEKILPELDYQRPVVHLSTPNALAQILVTEFIQESDVALMHVQKEDSTNAPGDHPVTRRLNIRFYDGRRGIQVSGKWIQILGPRDRDGGRDQAVESVAQLTG